MTQSSPSGIWTQKEICDGEKHLPLRSVALRTVFVNLRTVRDYPQVVDVANQQILMCS